MKTCQDCNVELPRSRKPNRTGRCGKCAPKYCGRLAALQTIVALCETCNLFFSTRKVKKVAAECNSCVEAVGFEEYTPTKKRPCAKCKELTHNYRVCNDCMSMLEHGPFDYQELVCGS